MSASPSSARDTYQKTLEDALVRHHKKPLKIRIAPSAGAFRKWPKAHFHGTPEFFLQTGGASDFDCPGGTFRLRRGEIGIVPVGVPHAEQARDTESSYSAIVVMSASDGFSLLQSFSDEKNRIGARDILHVPGKSGRNAFPLLAQITEDSISSPLRNCFQNHLVGAFLIALISDLKGGSSTMEPESQNPLVSAARKLALAQLPDPELGVSSIARQISCHPDHLSRCFQKALRVPLGEWIIEERIHMAKVELREGKRNIAEVAWACGFSTPSYFIKVFRTRTGSTPRQFREAS